MTSVAGAVTDKYEYDAFGNEFTVSGSTPNDYLYRGEQFDPDLGLYYLRARYYNPLTGRFLSRDPNNPGPTDATGTPADVGELHKYLYAGRDPVDAIDPLGRAEFVEFALLEGGSKLAVSDYVLSKTGLIVATCFYGLARSIYTIAHDHTFWPSLDGAVAIVSCAIS